MSNELINVAKRELDRFVPELDKAIPLLVRNSLDGQRIVRCVLNALQSNNSLMNADRQSIFSSAMTAAVLGLEIDNVTGQAYMVPFQGKAQLIPGYKGYISLAARSGFDLSGHIVREGDEFDYQEGSKPFVHHKPGKGGTSDRGEITYCYSIAKSLHFPDKLEVMHISDIIGVRDNSSGYKAFLRGKAKESTWVTNFAPMAKKTPIRLLGARLPLNVHMASMVETLYEGGRHSYINSERQVVVGDMQPTPKATFETPDLVDAAGNPINLKATDAEVIDQCGRCGGLGAVEWEENGESGTEPCPVCQAPQGGI